MSNFQIGIERESGGVVSYKIDAVIINGLYLTFDFDKVNENCSNFDIETEIPDLDRIFTTFSKREELVILTLILDEENQVQYLIGNDLNLGELSHISEDELPQNFKKLILNGFSMICV